MLDRSCAYILSRVLQNVEMLVKVIAIPLHKTPLTILQKCEKSIGIGIQFDTLKDP